MINVDKVIYIYIRAVVIHPNWVKIKLRDKYWFDVSNKDKEQKLSLIGKLRMNLSKG